MAVELQNSVFIHIPKTGGRTVTNMLLSKCKAAEIIGRPSLDAHNTPDIGDKIAFVFVREPAMFCHSLWHHRSRKKFNWQKYLRLENEFGSDKYDTFMEACAKTENLVIEYYQYYTNCYSNLVFGKTENLKNDLVKILEHCGENFNKTEILNDKSMLGKNPKSTKLDDEIRLQINEMNNFSALSGKFI